MANDENIHYLNDVERTHLIESTSTQDYKVNEQPNIHVLGYLTKSKGTDIEKNRFVTEISESRRLISNEDNIKAELNNTCNQGDEAESYENSVKTSRPNENKIKTVNNTASQENVNTTKTELYEKSVTEPDVVYKHKHKIGLRKASESVISYNEPMYQCYFKNTFFDKVKQSAAINSKYAESKRCRSLGNSPVKSTKVDFQRSLSFESVAKVKKIIIEKDFERSSTFGIEEQKSGHKEFEKDFKDLQKEDKITIEKGVKKVVTSESKEAKKKKQAKLQNEVAAKLKNKEKKLEKNLSLKQKSATKKIKDDTGKKVKERSPKSKTPIAQRRVKREASLNAVTFMNILYEKEDSANTKFTKQTPKRSKSEADVQVVAKKQKTSSVTYFLSSVEETIKEVVDRIRAEETINEVVERIRVEENITDYIKTNKVCENSVHQIIDDTMRVDNEEVFQKDKFDLIKIKANEAKIKKQAKLISDAAPIPANKSEENKVQSPEDIAEKKRKANLARLKKAKEILQQGKIKKLKADTKGEREILNMKLAKLSAVLQTQKKHMKESNNKSLKSETSKKDKQTIKNKVKLKEINKEIKPRNKQKPDNDTCRSARTHTENPKRLIRPSSCTCCQSYYQNKGSSYWNSRTAVDRGSYNQEPCPSTSTDLPPTSTVEIHPYSSPSHVQMIDTNPFIGQLMPAHGHIPQCNSCTCVQGAMMSTPCPQCPVGSLQVLTCHHQGYGSAYPVTFPHNHGAYSHCGCAYCSGGSFHTPTNPMMHQPMAADTSFLLHHPMSLQLPHESSHPLSIQLSHGDGSHIPHPIPHQVSLGETNPLHLSHVCNISHTEAANSTSVSSEQDYIDVGEENIVSNLENQERSSDQMDENSVSEIRMSSTSSSNNKGDKAKLCSIKTKSVKVKPRGERKSEDKLKKSESPKVKRKMSDSSAVICDKDKKGKVMKDKTKDKIKKDKVKEEKKKERKRSGGSNKEKVQKSVSLHGWTWEGQPEIRTVTSIFDGKQIQRKCYKAIKHDDGDIIQTRDCILVCSGSLNRDNPYVAKVTNFWEEPGSGEMMMTLLWYYRPEHTEAGRQPYHKDCEVFAAKHRDESPVACIDDRCYVLTYNEYCRFMAEVARTKDDLPPRKQIVPDQEEPYPERRIPPVGLDPENVLLCRNVYDFKLKRVLKNPS